MSAEVTPRLTGHVARRVAGVDAYVLAPAVLERARHSLIDWLAAAIAGSAAEPARSLWAGLDRAGGSAGPATVVGTPRRATARDAALGNGVAAHSLELDDIAGLMGGHPSVSVCTAVLTLADVLDAGGSDTLAAIVAGYDAACRIAIAFGPGHAAAGWHVTGTIGTFAAAAACARLLRLDVDGVESALGLAASSAAGISAAIGTSAKATHAGNAACDGMVAALLAAEGATGPAAGIEHYAAAAGAALDLTRLDELGDLQGIRSTVFKRHACCGLLQPTVTALARLRTDHRLTSDDVTRVDVAVSAITASLCSFTDPHGDLEAKFSIPHAAAVALAGDDTGPTAFSAPTAREPAMAALRKLVRSREHDERSTTVSVHLRSDEILETSEPPASPVADDDLPAQLAVLRAKFRRVVTPMLGPSRTQDLLTGAEGFDADSSVRELLGLTRPVPQDPPRARAAAGQRDTQINNNQRKEQPWDARVGLS